MFRCLLPEPGALLSNLIEEAFVEDADLGPDLEAMVFGGFCLVGQSGG